MDCNTKWDWENLVLFNSKSVECPKKQTTNWGIEDGITGTCPFRLYEGKDSSSGSELAPGSSTRSSISVCTDSSFKEVMKDTHFAFSNIKAFPGDFCKKSELDELSLPLESSIGSGESVIGLKLGKRMYFENNSTQAESLAGVPRSFIASNVKKIKSSNSITPRCQVEGCNIDLSSAKEYHRKHKVCANHSKCPKVVVGGLERRFCQQCSRFHSLSEFDAKKRSCRKRLSDHNTRRRKPQLDLVQFNTMRLPSPFSGNDGRRQINFVSNNVPHIYSRSSLDATWENTYDSKLTTSKGVLLKFGKTEGIDEPLDLAGTELPRAFNFPDHPFNGFLAAKGSKAETLSRGFEQPVLPQNLDSGRDFHRALSLLSNNSWGSYPPSNNSLGHSMNVNHAHNQHLVPSFPQTSAELCQTGHHSTDNLHSGPFQLFKAPYDDVLHTILFN